jgi:sugar-specific transcriptional regulator TrmB
MTKWKVKDFEIYLNDEGELIDSSRKEFIEALHRLFYEDYDDTDYYLYNKEANQYVRFYKENKIKVDIIDNNKANEPVIDSLVITHYDLRGELNYD